MGNVESGPGEPGSESNPLKVSENTPERPVVPEHGDRRSRSWDEGPKWGNDDWAPVDNNDWAPVDNRDWVDQENNGDFRNTTPPQDDKSGSMGYEQDSYEEVETDPEEDSAYMSDNGTQSLMGASAAVFHYLELAERRQQAAYLQDHQSEDISVSECSAAVFRFLEEEAVRGSAKSIVKFLETASVVSQVLLEDANSVSDVSAAVFKVLQKKHGSMSNRKVPRALVPNRNIQRPPPPQVINIWDDPRLNDDVQSAESVSEHSNAIVNKALDDTKSHGTKSISEFSSEIFRLLDRAKSIDSLSTSQKSSAIFHLMEEMPLASPTNASTLAFRNGRKSLNKPLHENRSSMPRIAEETQKEQHDTKTFRSEYSEAAKEGREDYPEVGLSFEEDEESRNDPAPPEAKSTSNLSEESEQEDKVGNIDLVFVESFDRAFNEFIARNPKLLVSKPKLLHHIRVCKLQKLFEYMEIREKEILTEMQSVQEEKVEMENDLHLKLREASRKKAARQINLQNDLQNLVLSTKHLEGKMGWKFVDACESRAKKQFQQRQRIKAKYPPPGENFTRYDLLQQIPEGEESETLRNAAHWPPTLEQSYVLSVEQEKDLRQFQVDNALKMSELTVLKKKLASYQILAKKHAWVESVLLRIDATTMSKLRAKFMKKLGVRM